ncbi:GtrA family protein [Dyella tabacisoli]|uniref:GtrA family protein n=1 Tax=Dyella tabacisoli TaxID=2282381 RepID=A0A369UKU5_9GAMM|nr:GtrA family protein [Dyella tabacisoli]RDD81186.1 GtrA family protein [Dyella tabacisoli]
MRLRHEVALFAIGGLIGLVVDAGIVQLLVSVLHWNPYYARIVSFLSAATATWWWNRQRTFASRDSGRSLLSEWGHWMVLMAGGAVVNYAVYVIFLSVFPWSQRWPALAVAVGSAMAAGVNFGSARLLLFKRTKTGL